MRDKQTNSHSGCVCNPQQQCLGNGMSPVALGAVLSTVLQSWQPRPSAQQGAARQRAHLRHRVLRLTRALFVLEIRVSGPWDPSAGRWESAGIPALAALQGRLWSHHRAGATLLDGLDPMDVGHWLLVSDGGDNLFTVQSLIQLVFGSAAG